MKKNIAYGVILTLAAYILLYFARIFLKAEHKAYVSWFVARSIAGNCEEDYRQNNRWPGSLDDFMGNNTRYDTYKNPFVFVPYSEDIKYGAIISYGRDNKEGGRLWNRDIEIRFPLEQWKKWNDKQKPWPI